MRMLGGLTDAMGEVLVRVHGSLPAKIREAKSWLVVVKVIGAAHAEAQRSLQNLAAFGNSVSQALSASWEKTVELARAGWQTLASALDFLQDQLLEIIATAVDQVLSPALASRERPPGGALASRRLASGRCADLFGIDVRKGGAQRVQDVPPGRRAREGDARAQPDVAPVQDERRARADAEEVPARAARRQDARPPRLAEGAGRDASARVRGPSLPAGWAWEQFRLVPAP